MEYQKAQLKQLFENFGFDADSAESMSASFLTADETKPFELPFGDIHDKVLNYAKPHLKTTFKKELSKDFKGQYTGEFINKIIAMSDGELSRKDFEHLGEDDDNVLRALEALKTAKSAKRPDDSEISKKYNDLVKAMEAKEAEFQEQLKSVHNEYGEKENKRQIYDYTLSELTRLQKGEEGKPGLSISVDPVRAAQVFLRDLEDKAIPKFDPTSKTVGVYSKEDPEVVYMHDGKAAKYGDLLKNSLKENNWIKESNGGSANSEAIKNLLGKQPPSGGGQAANSNQWGAGFKDLVEQARDTAA